MSHLSIELSKPGRTPVATVSFKVKNTGTRPGFAVPQLYLGLPSPSADVRQPPRQLKGFTKLALGPGKSQTVSFPLDERAFSYWDIGSGTWQVAPGCYKVFVGSSSRDLPLSGTIARGNTDC